MAESAASRGSRNRFPKVERELAEYDRVREQPPLRRPERSYNLVEVLARPILGADRKIEGFAGVVQDVTERKAAEERLKTSEAMFRTLCDAAPVGIFMMDASANCLYVNARWNELAGAAPNQALGVGWRRFVHAE